MTQESFFQEVREGEEGSSTMWKPARTPDGEAGRARAAGRKLNLRLEARSSLASTVLCWPSSHAPVAEALPPSAGPAGPSQGGWGVVPHTAQ